MNSHRMLDLDRLRGKKIVCLTLDLEQDYGDLLDEPYYEGLEHIPDMVEFLNKQAIPLTCFVQGSLLETHPDRIRQLKGPVGVEFELHSYSHPKREAMNTKLEVEKGKEAFYRFFGRTPVGYRSPMGVIKEGHFQVLAENGFAFDSSVFPSFRPGYFNNLSQPIRPYEVEDCGMVEFPLTPFSNILRIPLSLSYIKLLGKPYELLLRYWQLPKFIIFSIHMHDLFHLESSNQIPMRKLSAPERLAFRRIYGNRRIDGMHLLDQTVDIFQRKGYTFAKMGDIHQSMNVTEGKNTSAQVTNGGSLQRDRTTP